MAIGLLFEAPEVTQKQYDAVVQELGGSPPPGAVLHVAGPMEGGGWRVFEVWESREAFDRFFQEKLQRALQNAGIAMSGEPKVFPIHNMVQRDRGTGA